MGINLNGPPWFPNGIAIDAAGRLFFADQLPMAFGEDFTDSTVRVATVLSGRVTSLGFGLWDKPSCVELGSAGAYHCPPWWTGLAVDSTGSVVFFDNSSLSVTSIDATGATRTWGLLGTGSLVLGLAIDNEGTLFLSDGLRNRILSRTPDGTFMTLAGGDCETAPISLSGACGSADGGADPIDVLNCILPAGCFADGPASQARFSSPQGIALDAVGAVYVADTGNNRIRRIAPNGEVTTIAGDGAAGDADGTAADAEFDRPSGIAVTPQGDIYVTDTGNNKIRRIDGTGVTTIAGTGHAGFADQPPGSCESVAQFDHPWGIVSDSSGHLFVTDERNSAVREIIP
jgi:hypothetical protein